MMLVALTGTWAQEDHLRMHFDFSNLEGNLTADAVGGINAKVQGAAKVEEAGKYHVLNLGNGVGYLDMTLQAGTLIKSLDDFTFSACYCVDNTASLSGNGYFLWSFATSAACTQTAGQYFAYRLNAQRMALSPGGFGSEVAVTTDTESDKGRWIHVLYRQSGTKGELFIDGKRADQNASMPRLKEVFASVPIFCWIGRAPFAGDNFLKKTLVADIRLYDTAVGDEQVEALAAVASELEQEYRYGVAGDFTELKAMVEECRA